MSARPGSPLVQGDESRPALFCEPL